MSESNHTDDNPVENSEQQETQQHDGSQTELEDAPIDALGNQGAALKDQLQEAEDRVLRSQAELENYRRRARREMDEQRKYASQPLLTDLFPVMDNVDRAIAAAEQAGDATGLLEGFQMVAQQLIDTLAKHDCKRITALGEEFDPGRHEAISQMPSDEYPQGTVMIVAQEGYMLHDRAIRPAHVVVSTGPSKAAG